MSTERLSEVYSPQGEASSFTCLLVGASGLVGSALLKQLVHDPLVHKITVLSRRPLDVHGLGNSMTLSKLHIIEAPFNDFDAALKDVDADVVFCTLGTTMKMAKTKEAFRKVDYEYPLALAKWAEKNGSYHFLVVTAMGASTSSMFFYSRVKGELQEQLAKLVKPVVHVFQPSLLLGDRPSARLGESIGAWLSKTLQFTMVGSLRKYRAIKGEDVAQAMKRVAGQAILKSSKHITAPATGIQYYTSEKIAELALHTTG